MGEMSFDAATRAASLITGNWKLLCNTNLGAFAQSETKTVSLADSLSNYDMIFASIECGSWTSGSTQYLIVGAPDINSSVLFQPNAGGTAFGIYAKMRNGHYNGFWFGRGSQTAAYLTSAGNTVNILSYSAIRAGTNLIIYGLKIQ